MNIVTVEKLTVALNCILKLSTEDFTKIISPSELSRIIPVINCITVFLAKYAGLTETGDLEASVVINSCHTAILKFFSRLCASSKLNKKGENFVLSKTLIETIFRRDPLGLLLNLYNVWDKTHLRLLDSIRDDLVPEGVKEDYKKILCESGKNLDPTLTKFFLWACNTTETELTSSRQRDVVSKRFEFESDDDMVEEDANNEDGASKKQMDPVELSLLSYYTKDAGIFARTSTARNSAERKKLCTEAKMTHEQVEGWAIMLDRNPRRARIIQDFILFHNRQ